MKYFENYIVKCLEGHNYMMWAQEEIDSNFKDFPKNRKIVYYSMGSSNRYLVMELRQYKLYINNRSHENEVVFSLLYDNCKRKNNKVFRTVIEPDDKNKKDIFKDVFRRFVKRFLKTERKFR